MSNEQAKSDMDFGEVVRHMLEHSPHRAVAIELRHCPHCEEKLLMIHPFCEVATCSRCREPFPLRTPDWPLNQEPRAIDWEEAVIQLSANMPQAAKLIRTFAEENAGQRL